MGNILKGFPVRDVIRDDNPISASVVTLSDCPESFLTCSIPDLQLNSFIYEGVLYLQLNSFIYEGVVCTILFATEQF